MSNGTRFTVGHLGDGMAATLQCFGALLAILAKSDEPAKDLRCRPGDPHCPSPQILDKCLAYKRYSPELNMYEALKTIHFNLDACLDVLGRLDDDLEIPPGGNAE